jgi:hypothetical protein
MAEITIKDILISARQESVEMRHHYLGVEHLFIALLKIQGGLTSSILEDIGIKADYVVDAIRRKTGKGIDQRLWVGIPYTPRTEIILNIAGDMALDSGREINERDLLVSILDEGESVPLRVLKSLGVDLVKVGQMARTYTLRHEPQPLDIKVEFGPDYDRNDSIPREQLFLLRKMFSDYARIRVERKLTGFRNALILMVTPIHPDGTEDASVITKIDQVDDILDEAQRYETHIRSALPLQTARLEDKPLVLETSELAGIKYTLVAIADTIPQDLRSRLRQQPVDSLGELLKQELYAGFNKTWWKPKPFRFQVWREYDWLLPPVLTLDVLPEKDVPPNAFTMRIPFNRTRMQERLSQLHFGDVVILENFVVQKLDRKNGVLKLAIGYGSEADRRAYRVDVRGVGSRKHYRGEVIESLAGKVWKTRDEMLMDSARELVPDFDLRGKWIEVGEERIPNPLITYTDLLDRYINGSVSKIHGDLHLGNIIVGPHGHAWLIDFGHTRDGHTLFDWATLEISLLGDVVMPAIGDTWEQARDAMLHLMAISPAAPSHDMPPVFSPIITLREIVRNMLTDDNWVEYFTALSMCALRAVCWRTMSDGARRLMFLLSGWAMWQVSHHLFQTTDTPTPDEAEITDEIALATSIEGRKVPPAPKSGEVIQSEVSTGDSDITPKPSKPVIKHLPMTRRFDEPPPQD